MRSVKTAGRGRRLRWCMRGTWGTLARRGRSPGSEWPEEEGAALLLLRAGMLSHRIAVTEARVGAQDEAKVLLDEAARMFAELRDRKREAEALVGVGLCYWRQSAWDE